MHCVFSRDNLTNNNLVSFGYLQYYTYKIFYCAKKCNTSFKLISFLKKNSSFHKGVDYLVAKIIFNTELVEWTKKSINLPKSIIKGYKYNHAISFKHHVILHANT